jgi:hypothetical protein
MINGKLGSSLAGAALCATAVTAATMPATADSISLVKPIAAASLHDGGVDMVVYYVDHEDHFEVVATYTAQDGPYEPGRLRMMLVNGDTVSFGLPEHPGVLYNFERFGETVSVTTMYAPDQLNGASNEVVATQ